MQKKKRLIPFKFLPGSWGLKGKVFAEAEANYYYEGRDLDERLAEIRNDDPKELARHRLAIQRKYNEINDFEHDISELALDLKKHTIEYLKAEARIKRDHGRMSPHQYDVDMLDLEREDRSKSSKQMEQAEYDLSLAAIDHKHGRLTPYDYEIKCVNIEHPKKSVQQEIALLTVDLAHDKITQTDYDKKIATLKEEPWIGIIDQGFDADRGLGGVYFEFDWNEYWIMFLRMNGYHGHTEDQVVDMWFADVCRSQGVSPMALQDDGNIIPFSGRIVNRKPDE